MEIDGDFSNSTLRHDAVKKALQIYMCPILDSESVGAAFNTQGCDLIFPNRVRSSAADACRCSSKVAEPYQAHSL